MSRSGSPQAKDRGGVLPPMVSYAQNFEDVMIRRCLQDVTRGFYIDVGAFDDLYDSVTKWFYDSKWSGINIEPNPALWRKLNRRRRRDVNIQCALGRVEGS